MQNYVRFVPNVTSQLKKESKSFGNYTEYLSLYI